MPNNILELEDILYSGALAYGAWASSFEDELCKYLNVPNLIATNSYNSAMLVLITALNLQPGDEVIASPVSCLASNLPFINKKLKVVWADIDVRTGTLDPDSVREKISSKTKAIFHNHHCGIPGYIDEVNQLGKEYGIFVIDDCIEAFGSKYKEKIISDTGADAAVYSFQTVRLPNTIDGGGLFIKDDELGANARLIRDYGIDRTKFRDSDNEISTKYDVDLEGYGALLSNVNGYIGYKQMDQIDDLINKQRSNAEVWIDFFSERKLDVEILGCRENIDPNYWVFSLLAPNKKKMLDYFRGLGFYASGVHINNNIYSIFRSKSVLKGAEEFVERHLALPSGWWVDSRLISKINV